MTLIKLLIGGYVSEQYILFLLHGHACYDILEAWKMDILTACYNIFDRFVKSDMFELFIIPCFCFVLVIGCIYIIRSIVSV